METNKRKQVDRTLKLSFFTRYQKILLFALSATIITIIWEFIGQMGLLNPIFFAWPSTILDSLYSIFTAPDFSRHLSVTMFEMIVGYSSAIMVAIPIGILMGRVKFIENLLDPYISALNSIPRIALMPLIILIFGIGLSSKMFLVFLGSFFPILINTFNGVKNIDPLMVDMAKSFGAKRFALTNKVLIPSTMPYLLAGLRIGLSIAFIMVIVGEFFASTHGVGYMIAFEAARYNTSGVLAWVLIVSGMTILFTEMIRYFERKKW